MADTEVKVVDENNEKKDVDEPIAKKQKLDESAELKLEVDGDAKPTLEKEIVEQIEYYFGDSNLYRDKFMQAEIEKNEGWVSVSVYICLSVCIKMAEHVARENTPCRCT